MTKLVKKGKLQKQIEKRSYEKKVVIPNIQEIHQEIKKFAVPHGNGTIGHYLFANGMDYQRYMQSVIRNRLPVSYIQKLYNLGIMFPDEVLCTIYPRIP